LKLQFQYVGWSAKP